MKKLLAALIAFSFLSTSGMTFAEEKKDTKAAAQKADKAAKSAGKDEAAPKKKKKEGC